MIVGQRSLETLLPGVTASLIAAGAERLSWISAVAMHSLAGWHRRFPSEFSSCFSGDARLAVDHQETLHLPHQRKPLQQIIQLHLRRLPPVEDRLDDVRRQQVSRSTRLT